MLQAVDERGHDARTGHAEGVPEGDRAALDVELVPADAEVLGRRQEPYLVAPLRGCRPRGFDSRGRLQFKAKMCS